MHKGKTSDFLSVKGGWVSQLRTYNKDGLSLSVWKAYRGDGWVKKGRNLAYVLCTQPHSSERSFIFRDCTTGYLCLPCPLPIASSNKSLQGKDPLAFPLPVQKCLELGNFTSVFQMWGENLVLKKNLEFLEFYGFTLHLQVLSMF